MRLFQKLALAGLVLGMTAAPVTAQNLLQNPEFSFWSDPNHPQGWTVESLPLATVDRESATIHGAPYSARLTRNVAGTGSNFGLKQYIEVVPNFPYAVSTWCYDDDPNARGAIVITWCRADSTSLGSTSPVYSDSTIHGWQQLTNSATSPDSASLRYAKVLMRVYGFTGGPAGGVVYYDDASFGLASISEERQVPPRRIDMTLTPTIGTGEMRAAITLPRAADVTLAVYDLAGALRAQVFSGRLTAGHHDLAVDARQMARLPDGLYFAVLDGAAETAVVRKLTVQH